MSDSDKVQKWDYRSLDRGKIATTWDIYMLGITIVIGGQMFSWNSALDRGFNNALLSTLIMGTAYTCLTLCIAELTSTFPFSGGVYGLVRVTCDPFLGYMVAVCEAVQNIFYVAVSVWSLGNMVCYAVDCPQRYEPLIWFLFFASACMVHSCDGQVFLKVNMLIGLASLSIVAIYIISAIPQGDFNEHADVGQDLDGHDFMVHLPQLAWFYIGIETLPFATVYCARPRKQIPRAMLACMATLFCTSIGMLFAMSSQSPGSTQLAAEAIPCNFAFARLYGISERHATWFTIIPTYATAFGFVFAYSRQISAMASSGMIPKIFKWRIPWTGATYVAILSGSSLAMMVLLSLYYKYDHFVSDLFYWCSLASYVVYMSSFVSFIELRRKYSTVERHFVNPTGIPGAIVGMAIFTINFIAVLGFQGEGSSLMERLHPVIGFVVMLLAGTAWYFAFVVRFQRFAVEEQKVLFSAYVIKSNLEGRKKLKGRNQRTSKAGLQRSMSMSSNNSTATSDMMRPITRLFSSSTMSRSLYTQSTHATSIYQNSHSHHNINQHPTVNSGSGSENNAIMEESLTIPPPGRMTDSERLVEESGKSFHLTTLREMVQQNSAPHLPQLEGEGVACTELSIEKELPKHHLSLQSMGSTGVIDGMDMEGNLPPEHAKIVVQDSTIKSIRKLRSAISRLSFNGGTQHPRVALVVDSNSMFCTSAQVLPLSQSMDNYEQDYAAMFEKPSSSTSE